MTDTDRIDALEMTLADQQQVIDDLSAEVQRQGEAIDRLLKAARSLGDRFQALEDMAPAPEQTKPPHY